MVNISIRAGYMVNFSMRSRTKGYPEVFSAKRKKGKVSKGRRSWIATVILTRIVFRKIIGQRRLLRECISYLLKNKKISLFENITVSSKFRSNWDSDDIGYSFVFWIYLISIFLSRLGQGCELKDPRRLLVAISISVAFSRLPDLAVFVEERAIYFSNYFSVRYHDKMD